MRTIGWSEKPPLNAGHFRGNGKIRSHPYKDIMEVFQVVEKS